MASPFNDNRVSAEDGESSGWWRGSRRTEKCWVNSRSPLRRQPPDNPRPRRQSWDHLWSLHGDLNRHSEETLHCREVWSPARDKWSEYATNSNLVPVPHPPYSRHFASSNFAVCRKFNSTPFHSTTLGKTIFTGSFKHEKMIGSLYTFPRM
jgi:hypothetical protein